MAVTYKAWITRCGVLLGTSVVLAAVYAGVRPMPPGALDSYTQSKPPEPAPSPGVPNGDASTQAPGADAHGDVHDLAWFHTAATTGTHWVVDARPLREYAEAHVAGAVHLDFGMFSRTAPEKVELLRGMPIVVYCGGGDCDASHKVKTMLEANGLTDIFVFVPGFPAWEQAGYPLESGDSPF